MATKDEDHKTPTGPSIEEVADTSAFYLMRIETMLDEAALLAITKPANLSSADFQDMAGMAFERIRPRFSNKKEEVLNDLIHGAISDDK